MKRRNGREKVPFIKVSVCSPVWADGYTLVDLILEANHEGFIRQTPLPVVVSASPRPASAHLLSCAGAEEQKQGRSVTSDGSCLNTPRVGDG